MKNLILLAFWYSCYGLILDGVYVHNNVMLELKCERRSFESHIYGYISTFNTTTMHSVFTFGWSDTCTMNPENVFILNFKNETKTSAHVVFYAVPHKWFDLIVSVKETRPWLGTTEYYPEQTFKRTYRSPIQIATNFSDQQIV